VSVVHDSREVAAAPSLRPRGPTSMPLSRRPARLTSRSGRSGRLAAAVSAIFTALLTTARKRGENLFQILRSVAGPSRLHAASLPT